MIRVPRMTVWLVVSLLLFGLIFVLAPQELPVAAYKLALITTAAWVGYWIDRELFPYGRPDRFMGEVFRDPSTGEKFRMDMKSTDATAFAAAMLRRALVIAAAMIAVALGA
jgi:putative holin